MMELDRDRAERRLPDAKPGYSAAEAVAEANRCLYCYNAPCIPACPTGIDIPTFIKKIATGNIQGSAKTILDANILGYSCGRVCPVEVLCVGACVYNRWHRPPIQIGRLQRYATENVVADGDAKKIYRRKPPTGKRVALVGAGPASLSCAAYLAMEGHEAILFEKGDLAGGLNTTGVAPYKLHAEDSLLEVEFVRSLGVEIRTGVEVGTDLQASQLLEEYDSVFLGIGLGEDSRLGIPEEEGPGVIGATDWIRRMKLDPNFSFGDVRRAAVVGGGNTAVDVVRELKQLGVAEVTLVYRRTLREMPAYDHEWIAARMEGVTLWESAGPTGLIRRDGRLIAIDVARCEGGKPIAGTEKRVDCDLMVVAIGQSKAQALAAMFPGVRCDSGGRIVIDPDTGQTGNTKVFSGGDCVNGGKEVVNAVADGRRSARAIQKMLAGPERKVSHG